MTAKRTPPYYDREFADREFTPEQITKQGRMLLNRALNIGNAIAFVGSGLSAAYGRPTWSQLVDDAGEQILNQSNSGNKAKIEATMRALGEAYQPGVSDPDLLPLKAHVYQAASGNDELGESILQRQIKERVRDDKFAARKLWEPVFAEEGKDPAKKPEPASGQWESADTCQVLSEIALKLALGTFEKPLKKLSQGLGSGTERCTSEERWIAPLLFSIAHVSNKFGTVRDMCLQAHSSPTQPKSPQFDPARYIFEDLRFRRVLTTNYDFELEKALHGLGFKVEDRPGENDTVLSASRDEAVGTLSAKPSKVDGSIKYIRPRGDRARTLVLRKDTAAELTGFAVQALDVDYEIFHLHGRALKGRDEELIVTERDYQRAYLRDSPEAHVMDEALGAAMGGNPVVFIGMGMLEADILRPLRRFVSNSADHSNRSVIAIMPTEEPYARRVKTALMLYLRYGVHTLFYGHARPDREDVDEDEQSWIAPKTFDSQPWLQPPGCPLLAEPGIEEPALHKAIALTESLKALLKQTDVDRAREWFTCTESPVGHLCEVLAPTVFSPAYEEQGLLAPARDALEILLRSASFWENAGARTQLREFIIGLNTRIRTMALCDALQRLSAERLRWWGQWKELPASRTSARNIERLSATNWESLHHKKLEAGSLEAAKDDTFRSVRFLLDEADIDEDTKDAIDKLLQPAKAAGRRVFVVQSEEGAGRGSFFHGLAKRFAHSRATSKVARSPYAWGAFTSTTFSTEYSSVVDSLIDFLSLCNPAAKDDRSAKSESDLSRRDRLLDHLERMFPGGQKNQRRGLIVIGGADLLFRSDGSPKNFEIVDALSAFLSSKAKGCPIDVVIMCRAHLVGDIFGQGLAETRRGQAVFGRGGQSRGEAFQVQKLLKLGTPKLDAIIDSELERESKRRNKPHKTKEEMLAAVSKLSENWRNEPRHWRKAMKGRFHVSLVTSCAAETYWEAHDRAAERRKQQADVKPEAEAAIAVHKFLTDLGDTYSRAEGRRKADVALSSVLRQYAVLKGRDNHIPADLCETILKHLAIMSAPIELDTLLRCPEIKAHKNIQQEPSHESKVKRLNEVMQWLVGHRLCFASASRRELRDGELRFSRFVAHQSLQSYFFRQIGSPHLKFGDSRLFTVSVCASQPTELPAPSWEAYRFMRDLIRALTDYPGSTTSSGDGAGALEVKTEIERKSEVCALRAALGLARSAFSLAVVTRFAEFDERRQENKKHAFGCMEEFRLLLRWLIFQSGMRGVEHTDETPKDEKARLVHLRTRINALYQDEITWLYNECGLTSLAQGNLNDAAALLNMARRSNKGVEGRSRPTPNSLRIGLNASVVRLERGHLQQAYEDLGRIESASGNEPVIQAIARGYRGLIYHLKGKRNEATKYYVYALENLRKNNSDARAVSVFSKHYGDLLRAEDVHAAREQHRAALAEAEVARQYDQVHRTHISIIQDNLIDPGPRPDVLRESLKHLDEIMRYADEMELYGLKVDALIARASLIERQGETRAAGEAAIAALSLANLHGQRLRTITALTVLGRVVAGRTGYRDQAVRILRNARTMAEPIGYQLVLDKVDRQLIQLNSLA